MGNYTSGQTLIPGRLTVGDEDAGWFNITQDGKHYRVSPQDLDSIYQSMGGGKAPASNPYTSANLTNYSTATASGSGTAMDGGANGGSPGSSYSQYVTAANTADPFAGERGKYTQGLKELMTNGSSAIASDPSYKNRFEGGQQAVERSQAARGFLGSGNMATALIDYGQKAASDEYQAQYNRLQSLAGVDKSSPTAAGQILALAPGQNLAEKNAAFNWNTQSAMLPYQMQGADIQNQMLQRQNTEGQQAFNKNQYALEQQANAPQLNFGKTFIGNAGSGFSFSPDQGYQTNMYTTPSTDEQIAQRRRALGLL